MTELIGYLLLFLVVGIGFIFIHLVAGKFIRPIKPSPEKLTIYECGEPTIGSAWIQFDLRFYVVALLFVIFDVEVVFFFPWALVFGKANTLATLASPSRLPQTEEERSRYDRVLRELTPPSQASSLGDVKGELGRLQQRQDLLKGEREKLASLEQKLNRPDISQEERLQTGKEANSIKATVVETQAALEGFAAPGRLAWLSFWDILVFFGVLLVGFAYLWKRGDLDWVRSTMAERTPAAEETTLVPAGETGVLA